MGIHVNQKPVVKPLNATALRELVAYRVVEVSEKDCGVKVDDVVLKFPAVGHGNYILNVTEQRMLWQRADSDGFHQPFKCVRAHEIASIVFTADSEDRPG